MGEAARAMNSARMITLTAPHLPIPLAEHLALLRKAFGILRKSPKWRARVKGGLYAIECTRNLRLGEWHPHIHALCDGWYFPGIELREAWREALNAVRPGWGGSPSDPLSTEIELIRDREAASKYVAKYLTKPSAIAHWPLDAIREFAVAMHGGRLLHTFGSLHGANLDPAEPAEPEEPSTRIASLAWVNMAARRGNRAGRAACMLFRVLFPRFGSWVPEFSGPLPPDLLRPEESNAAAFCRLAAQADREFWADVPAMHAGKEPPPTRKPPPERGLQLDLAWGIVPG